MWTSESGNVTTKSTLTFSFTSIFYLFTTVTNNVAFCTSPYIKVTVNWPRTPTSISWTARASIRLAALCFPSSLVSRRIVDGRPQHRNVVSTCCAARPLPQPVKASNSLSLKIPITDSKTYNLHTCTFHQLTDHSILVKISKFQSKVLIEWNSCD